MVTALEWDRCLNLLLLLLCAFTVKVFFGRLRIQLMFTYVATCFLRFHLRIGVVFTRVCSSIKRSSYFSHGFFVFVQNWVTIDVILVERWDGFPIVIGLRCIVILKALLAG
jgi:hypothetical protein